MAKNEPKDIKQIQKVPPNDQVAEKSVLGGILIDPSAITLIIQIIRADHFYYEEHRNIFEAMIVLFEKQQPIDLITLSDELKHSGNLEKIGGTVYLSELIDIVPTSAYIEHYANIVKNNFIKRCLITIGSKIVRQAFDDRGEVKKMLDTIETELFGLSQTYLYQEFAQLKTILADSFNRLEQLTKKGTGFRGLPTGFSSLDSKLSGFQDSNLIVLAARPAIGKTTLALNIASYCALVQKASVGIFSLEMSKEELVDRLLVAQADIDAWKLKTGKLSDDDYTKLTESMGELADASIYIDDTPGASVLEMRTKARKLKFERDLKLIIVDYMQLVDPGKRVENRVQEVSFISQQLKNLARELKIPVLALSQLSRAIEHRGEKKPQLADLRESGSIEQDADVVMFLYNPKETEDLLDETKRVVNLLIAKHRNGPTGEIQLMFRGDRVKFYGISGDTSSKK